MVEQPGAAFEAVVVVAAADLGKLADLFGMKSAFLVVPVLIVIAFGINLVVAREMDKQKNISKQQS